jgi:hypothetical protein
MQERLRKKVYQFRCGFKKIKERRFFYTALVKKKSHSAGDVLGKESGSTEKFDFTKYT